MFCSQSDSADNILTLRKTPRTGITLDGVDITDDPVWVYCGDNPDENTCVRDGAAYVRKML